MGGIFKLKKSYIIRTIPKILLLTSGLTLSNYRKMAWLRKSIMT